MREHWFYQPPTPAQALRLQDLYLPSIYTAEY